MRFAFFSPPLSSHLAVHGALAEELGRRGHECFLVHHADVAGTLRNPALQLAPVDPTICSWSPRELIDHTRRPGLPFGLFRLLRDMAAMTDTLCRVSPEIVGRLSIDAIVTDQMESAGALVAEHLGLPFASVAAAVPINREPNVPLAVLDWAFEDSSAARRRNAGGERVSDWLTRHFDGAIGAQARALGCTPKRRQADCVSPFAQISQLLPGFDFPRVALPTGFHYVGPLRGSSQNSPPFPKIRSDRPFVFMSLGTMQGHRIGLFRKVAKACRDLGFRLMVAHCGGLTGEQASSIDADWVVDRVSQEEAVARADIVVSHAGLNTVMDALQSAKPMLCFPLAFDQPGLGARVRRLGAGIVLSRHAGVHAITQALHALKSEPSYRQRSGSLSGEFAAAGGVSRAASIIETVARSRSPVAHSLLTAAA